MRQINAIQRMLLVVAILAFAIVGQFQNIYAGGDNDPADVGNDTNADQGKPTRVQLYTPGEVVVAIQGESSLVRFSANLLDSMSHGTSTEEIVLLKLEDGKSPEVAATELMDSAWVKYAHPNYVLQNVHPVQGSYPFSDKLSTGNYTTQSATVTLNTSTSLSVASGDGIQIAVIDGGIDLSHNLLEGSASYGYDYVDNDAVAFDELGGYASGHGTFVAGVIHLIAPDANLVAYRIMNANGQGDGFGLAQAIVQAVNDGCDVINLSLVLTDRHLVVRDAINYARDNGVVVVAAAGNSATDAPCYPAAEEHTIAVTATDTTLQTAHFANFGDYVDVSAPGTNIYSAFQGGENAWWSGTSFAAPFVTGQVAALRELRPTSSTSEIKTAITSTAVKTEPEGPGNGVIDPVASLSRITDTLSATVTPDTVEFNHVLGTNYFVAPTSTVLLTSDNAPASYTTEVITDSAISGSPVVVVCLRETVGMTNDSVVIDYCNLDAWPVGEYYNTVLFHVDGISRAAELTVKFTVDSATSAPPVASITPSTLFFTVPLGADPIVQKTAILSSTNSPAPYTAFVAPSGSAFTRLLDTAGMTPDSIRVEVNPSGFTSPGFYYDTALFYVEGVSAPAVLTVSLQITADTGTTEVASLVYDSSDVMFNIEQGSTVIKTGVIWVNSTNAPARFFAEVQNAFVTFLSLHDSIGVTNDSVAFDVAATGLSEGVYSNTILFTVDGVSNNPVGATVWLTVTSSGTTGDSAYATPSFSFFTAPFGVDTSQQMNILVGASGPSKPFVASHLSASNFTPFIDSVGFTDPLGTGDTLGAGDDIITYNVTSSSSWAVGIYADTIMIGVDSVTNSPLYVIQYLNITDSVPDTTGPATSPHIVRIGETGPMSLGQFATIDLTYDAPTNNIGGFDFLITYDASALTFIQADEGSLYPEKEWEYFSSRHSPDSSGTPTSGGIIRIVGLADLNNGDHHPITFAVDQGDTFATLTFQTGLDSSLAGTFQPVRWLWMDCGDNAISNTFGDTLFVSRYVFDYNSSGSDTGLNIRTELTDPTASFPTIGGAPAVCDGTESITPPIRLVDFLNGGIRVMGNDTIVDTIVTDTIGTDTTGTDTIGTDTLSDTIGTVSVVAVGNHPNPFNPTTKISFTLTAPAQTSLTIYDILGRKVKSFDMSRLGAGQHQVEWNGDNEQGRRVASGIYLYRLVAGTTAVSRKMVLLK